MSLSKNTFTTGEVRLSYEHLTKPDAAPGVEPCYSVVALIPKTDTFTLAALNAAWEDAKQFGIANKWNGTLPPVLQGGLKDGDGVKSDGTPYGPECKGHYLLTCKTNVSNPPEIVDENLDRIIDPRKIYSGCYGRVNVSMVPYNNQSKGIKAILNCVQILRDGEPLGGKTITAAQAFGAPAVPQAVPGAYPAPAVPQAMPVAPQAVPGAYPAPAAPQAMPGAYPAPAAPQAVPGAYPAPAVQQAASGYPVPQAPVAPGTYPQQAAAPGTPGVPGVPGVPGMPGMPGVPGTPGAGQAQPTGMPVLGL